MKAVSYTHLDVYKRQGVDCAVGDRVFVASRDTGTYAEYVVADASSVWPLPAGVSFAQGASLGIPGLAAHRALFELSLIHI